MKFKECLVGLVLATSIALTGCESKKEGCVPKYNRTIVGMRVGTYRGHRVEISPDKREVVLYYANFTPDQSLGFISAVIGKDGKFESIKGNNLTPNDSLKEFVDSNELEKAYSKVINDGWTVK